MTRDVDVVLVVHFDGDGDGDGDGDATLDDPPDIAVTLPRLSPPRAARPAATSRPVSVKGGVHLHVAVAVNDDDHDHDHVDVHARLISRGRRGARAP